MASEAAVARTRARAAAAVARAAEAFVPTPARLAKAVTSYPYSTLGTPGHPRVLEPSAGAGALVRAILDADSDAQVVAVEPNGDRAQALQGLDGVTLHVTTFEEYAAGEPSAFDEVDLNPPFSLPGRPRVWIEHILAAWELLRPGGRLVAIAPPTLSTGNTPAGKEGQRLRQLVDEHGGADRYDATMAEIRAGFAPSVDIVWLARPMPTADGRPSWLLSPAEGEPVDVTALDVTPTAALTMPVQRYVDRWDGDRPRVVRYVGTCQSCARLLWAHDEGQEPAQVWAANSCQDAEELGMVGPTVGVCMECAHRRNRWERALEAARGWWLDVAEELPPAMVEEVPPAVVAEVPQPSTETLSASVNTGRGRVNVVRMKQTKKRTAVPQDTLFAMAADDFRGQTSLLDYFGELSDDTLLQPAAGRGRGGGAAR